MNNHIAKLALIAACAGFASSGLQAGTATSNLAVSATVVANCLISTTALSFGNYDPISTHASNPLDSTGTVLTTCTTGSSPTITLGEGLNAGGGSSAASPVRQLKDASDNLLGYQLYSDSNRSDVWDNDSGVAAPTPDGTQKSSTVYGRVAGGQNMPVGAYADTVVATVSF